jgi:phytoene synthase
MNQADYYQQSILRPGASLYYSLLFTPAAHKSALLCVESLWQQLKHIPFTCSDAGVARSKLYWWQEDLSKVPTGKAEHPINQQLTQVTQQYALDITHCIEVVHALFELLNHAQFADWAALAEYSRRTYGNIMRLRMQILANDDVAQLAGYADVLAQVIQLTELINHLKISLQRQLYLLPGVHAQSDNIPDALQTLYTELQRSRQCLTEFDHPTLRRAQLSNLILANIKFALLTEIQRDNFPVLQQRTTLTPLRKLWIAWRTYINPMYC